MTKTRNLIAVLDDELQFCKALSRLLKTHGFEVAMFQQGDVFFAACAARLPDCVLLDLHMPEPNGFTVLERMAGRGVPVLVITGHDQPGNAESVRRLGGAGYFLKPVNESELVKAIRAALENATQKMEVPDGSSYQALTPPRNPQAARTDTSVPLFHPESSTETNS